MFKIELTNLITFETVTVCKKDLAIAIVDAVHGLPTDCDSMARCPDESFSDIIRAAVAALEFYLDEGQFSEKKREQIVRALSVIGPLAREIETDAARYYEKQHRDEIRREKFLSLN